MSRVSEDIYVIGDVVTVACFHCGNKADRGGRWLGVGQEVVICRESECVRSAIHLVFDAIHDVTEDIGATKETLETLLRKTLSEKGLIT